MKVCFLILSIIFGILLIINLITMIIWESYLYPKKYEYSLRLSDDASLPSQKAKYLREYYNKVKDFKQNPRYIFMTPDLELHDQKTNIRRINTKI
jgi:hypothetical protein